MSLYKQLWLAIAALMTVTFLGSFVVSTTSAKGYLENQLSTKNNDNAQALALRLSSGDSDQVTMDLAAAALFDSGHYQSIVISDPHGSVIVERQADPKVPGVPGWFMDWFKISPKAGMAKISDGWRQVGTVTLRSHAKFAYRELWGSALKIFSYFVTAAVVAGLIGFVVMRAVFKPLRQVVSQAEAIGTRTFLINPLPKTTEFNVLVRSMNSLAQRVKEMSNAEAQSLDSWRRQLTQDPVSGVLSREAFLTQLDETLSGNDEQASGALIILRIKDMVLLNRQFGRSKVDLMLADLGGTLDALAGDSPPSYVGRLNGSDFTLLLPTVVEVSEIRERVQSASAELSMRQGMHSELEISIGTGFYNPEIKISDLLGEVDSVLADAEALVEDDAVAMFQQPIADEGSAERWRYTLEQAFDEQRFELDFYPVHDRSGALLHSEAPARLVGGKDKVYAAEFMPWINRYGLGPQLDLQVAELALRAISQETAPGKRTVGINLSTQLLEHEQSILDLAQLIEGYAAQAPNLWLEAPEYGVYQHLPGFTLLCQRLIPLGCKLGVEHIGPEVAKIGELHNLGLDFVKVSATLVRDIHVNTANQVFLKGLCSMVHAIGLTAIAEGVRADEEWEMLMSLGFDAGTGPYFS